MPSVAIVVLAGMVFSGLGIWILGLVKTSTDRGPRARGLFILYTGLGAQIAAEIFLAALSMLRDVQAALAADRELGVLLIDGAAWLIFAGRFAALFAAASAGRALAATVPRARATSRGLPPWALPAAWAAAYIACRVGASALPIAALPALDAAFLAVAAAYPSILAALALRFLRESRPRRAQLGFERAVAAAVAWGYLPARLILVLADAALSRGVPPLAFAWIDAGFFLALNLALYLRFAFGGARGAGGAGAREAGEAFLARCETFGLSKREIEVASILVSSGSYKDAASALGISADTVKSHAKSLYRKTKARDRFELLGILGPSPENPPE